METTTQTTPASKNKTTGAECAWTTPSKGEQQPKKYPLNEVTPPSRQRTSLADQTIAAVAEYFGVRRHHPSLEMWIGLRAVAETMEKMADGRCPPIVHLSSLDPGVGKTTTVICFLRSLIASKPHEDVAVLICVRRKDQIEAIVGEAQLARSDFTVLTADETLNGLGGAPVDQARVLFTTHAMIEARCAGKSFCKASAFHYRGKPRQVRVWDEAILPGRPLTIGRDALASLLSPLRGRYPAFADDIEDLFVQLKTAANGSIICLPDLAEIHHVELNDLLEVVADRPEQMHAIEILWLLLGKHVTVRKDGVNGNTVLNYEDRLPEDITPLLALDASGRVRTAYEYWQEDRGGLVRLPSAAKCYDGLTIHVWDRGGGKSTFRREAKLFAQGIAETILTRSDEEWLVIYHKNGIDLDFEAEVRARLPIFGPQVHFLHWGVHDATNQYADVPNVILAGTLFFRPSHYEALGRLASAHPSSRGAYDGERIEQITRGEHRNLVLQALCRGAVRKCIGDRCPPARAYIIASRRSGIVEELPYIFPGAKVVPWRPIKRTLSGRVAEAVEYIVKQLAVAPWRLVPFREVMNHVVAIDPKDFKRRIRRHPDFVSALSDAGIVEWGAGKYPRGFCLAVDLCEPQHRA